MVKFLRRFRRRLHRLSRRLFRGEDSPRDALDEIELSIVSVRAKMYEEAFRLEKKRQEYGDVFDAE